MASNRVGMRKKVFVVRNSKSFTWPFYELNEVMCKGNIK
jgi:hypothetical protein